MRENSLSQNGTELVNNGIADGSYYTHMYISEWEQITNACQRPQSIQTTTLVDKARVHFVKLSTKKIEDHQYLGSVEQHNVPCADCCTCMYF